MFGGNFAPLGWEFCEGQLLPISENETLFQLIGTTYGGDGQSNFALPNLQSRVPIHQGTGSDGVTYQIGEMGGVEQVTLTTNQIPTHRHTPLGTNAAATSSRPDNHVFAAGGAVTTSAYGTDAPMVTLAPSALGPAGGSQPHENVQPFLCINFIISLYGYFPSQT